MNPARLAVLFAALLLPLSALALIPPAPPRIVSISPTVGSPSENTLVRIVLEGFEGGCIAPCPTPFRVFFGGIAASDVKVVGYGLTAVAPPHGAGSVDVTVTWGTQTATLPEAFMYIHDFAQRDFEAVLIPAPLVPASAPVPGAHGSLWSTEFWMRNNSDASVAMTFGEACPPCDPPSQFPTSIAAHQTVEVKAAMTAPGLMLYVPRSAASLLSYSLRVRDLSRTTLNEGTAVPVLRESEFAFGPIELLNVPIDANSRAALRIFSPAAESENTARVNVYSLTDPAFFVTTLLRLTLSRPAIPNVPAVVPGYATVNDLRTALALPPGKYRVEVKPLGVIVYVPGPLASVALLAKTSVPSSTALVSALTRPVYVTATAGVAAPTTRLPSAALIVSGATVTVCTNGAEVLVR